MEPGDFSWVWDDENQNHMWEQHGTTADEVEEVYYEDEPVFTDNYPPHKAAYIVYGLTRDGRLLVVPFNVVRQAAVQGQDGILPR